LWLLKRDYAAISEAMASRLPAMAVFRRREMEPVLRMLLFRQRIALIKSVLGDR
jgi:hypothetical protein